MTSIINKIRVSTGSYFLRKKLKGQTRKVVTRNLTTTQSAGILFEAGPPENMALVKELIHDLSTYKISTKALGYIHGERSEVNYIGDTTFSFISKKEFSFLYQTQDEAVLNFLKQPFDLLIVFCQHDYFPIKYIGNLSASTLKVGQTGICNDMLDMMIELSKGAPLSQLKEHLMHYLKILNKPLEKTAI